MHICTVPAKTSIEELIRLSASVPVFDVRSPAEFEHAHIPGAVSFPIFNNEERKIIGTAYKQESRSKAIRLGLDFFGKKMSAMVEEADRYFSEKKITRKEVLVHCWRGGMRSAAVAWLLDLYGYKVTLLQGGYKSYRHWALQQFEKDRELLIVGGCTGGNKTGLLHSLKKSGEAVLDLEEIAIHKGSAFGNLEGTPQPSQEHFENLLAWELNHLDVLQKNPIWVEGESQRLGNVNIPMPFFKKMRAALLLFVDIPFENRLSHIVEGYGRYSKESLINATLRIKKRLGGLETKTAINALIEDDVRTAFGILLKYYDKLYLKSIYSKELAEREIIMISTETTSPEDNLKKVLEYGKSRQH
jgi:tRNA 2-selenouridine synthase